MRDHVLKEARPMIRLWLFALLLGSLVACTTNPVTGRSELSLMSEQQELAIGNEQYRPAQQSQGGVLNIDPGLSAYVNEVGQRLVRVSDRPLPYEFVVLNNSVPNAWALPGGKIAVNRGLLTALDSEAALAAVLGHEIVHAAARHSARAATRSMVLQGALIAGAIATSDNEYSGLIVGGAALGSELISRRYGRDAERESDFYGIQYMVRAGYDPNGAVQLMETFVGLAEGRDPSWLDGLFASHPPSRERLDSVRAQVAAMDLSGLQLEMGSERYQQQLAFLREAEPAYALLDDAHEAIRDDDLETAMDKLQQANTLLPQEARFDGLRGDILLTQRRYREAIEAYDVALGKNADYFDYYLGRGLANARLGNRTEARADLQRSVDLLPTAPAMLELGNLALSDNDRATAKNYFQSAAAAQGPIGEQAVAAFLRLDLPDNPGAYLTVQALTDQRNQILAAITNNTPLAVGPVSVEFHAVISGRLQSVTRTVSSLAAGSTMTIGSGLVLPEGVVGNPDNMQVRLVSAAVP
ncbi:MAG: hypothetical protein RLZZ385_366 [Pseudomonadota bacterium]|jgi:predicted Zn-dependent protease